MTLARAGLLASLAAAALLAAPALAQEGEDGGDDTIVVTGQAEQPTIGEITRQAREITQGSAFFDKPLPRFQNRLCPGVLGMKAEYASLIIDRIRAHAEKLDMWLTEDDGTCTPNLIVAFVKDGQAAINKLEEENGYLFADMPLPERRALMADDGPVRVWTITATKTRDGMPVPKNRGGEPPQVSMWMAHSKIYSPIREDIEQVVVLFNYDHVMGKSLTQLADYATMRGIARTKPADAEDEGPAATILQLFDEDVLPPAEMTEFDRAYLASLYDGIPNIAGITKINGVSRQLRLQAKQEDEQE